MVFRTYSRIASFDAREIVAWTALGFDLDNTIICYDEAIRFSSKLYPSLPASTFASKTSVKDYFLSRGLLSDWIDYQSLLYGPLLEFAKPYPHCIEALTSFRRQGYQLYIISHKTEYSACAKRYNLRKYAFEWLEKSALTDVFTGHDMRNVVNFNNTVSEKVRAVGIKDVALFVDDLPEILNHPNFPALTKRVFFNPLHRFVRDVSWEVSISSWVELNGVVDTLMQR